MRKDAKIGFAIGGVLLAVLTVYAVIVPRKHAISPNGVSLALPPGGAVGTAAPSNEPEPPVTSVPATGAPSTEQPTRTASDDKPAAGDTKTDAVAKSGDSVNWAKLLSGSAEAPTLMSATPSPDDAKQGDAPAAPEKSAAPAKTEVATADTTSDASAQKTSSPDRNTDTPPALIATSTVHPSHGGAAAEATPATHPVNGRPYVIKPGQTLSAVASEVYGNSRFYVAILRANPGLNPSKLRPGMRITLPDISEVRPDVPVVATPVMATEKTSPRETSSEKTSVATSGRTYKVESGDNLYRISKKLFGSPKMAEAIYKLNEDEIGPDKAKLKLDMVLKLPEAPAAEATASR